MRDRGLFFGLVHGNDCSSWRVDLQLLELELRSTHRSGSYAKFYSFLLTTTTITIDLSSSCGHVPVPVARLRHWRLGPRKRWR